MSNDYGNTSCVFPLQHFPLYPYHTIFAGDLLNSLDWFLRKRLEDTLMFDGKKHGVRFRCSQAIHWCLGWLSLHIIISVHNIICMYRYIYIYTYIHTYIYILAIYTATSITSIITILMAIHPLPTIPKKIKGHPPLPLQRLRLTPAVSSRNQWLPSRPARRSRHAAAPPGGPSRLRTCANKRRHLGGSQALRHRKIHKKRGLSYKKVDF